MGRLKVGNTTYTVIPNPDPSRLKYAVHDGTDIVAEYATYVMACEYIQKQWNRADAIDHPAHYGGADNPYEAIKIIEALDLGFCLGNCIKYIVRAGKKQNALEDLEKAKWYLNHEIERLSSITDISR